MKESELLRIQANEALNDEYCQYLNEKADRAERSERFKEYYLLILQESEKVKQVTEKNHMFVVDFVDGLSVDYYPKADKVLLKKAHQWKTNGLSWLLLKIQNDL